MGTFGVVALPIVAIMAWIMVGWCISGSLQAKNHAKLAARIAGTGAGFAVGVVVFIIGLVIIGNEESTAPAATQAEHAAVKTFAMTPEQFSARMNQSFASLGVPFRTQLQMQRLEHGSVAKVQFNAQNGLVVTGDNASGKLKEVMVIISGNGTMSSGLEALSVALASVSATLGDNELKTGKSAEIVMGLIKGDYPDDITVVNNIRYSLVRSKDGLNTFFIRPL